jgi:hypothetical protein
LALADRLDADGVGHEREAVVGRFDFAQRNEDVSQRLGERASVS